MVTLRLLGSVSLETEDGPVTGRSAQRRRIALLALLAMSRGRPVSRDKIVGYLWPESGEEKARRLLSESLYVIRKALGEDSVLAEGDGLRLNPEIVWADTTAFLEALERGNPEEAVELFRGPFLDGFFISDAPEFEHWVDGEREDLGHRFAEALQRLAEEADERGDAHAAVVWWRRLAGVDRFDARIAVAYMMALEAAGQRAAALQHARVHAALLREEFEAEPDPDVEQLAERLRDAPLPSAPPEHRPSEELPDEVDTEKPEGHPQPEPGPLPDSPAEVGRVRDRFVWTPRWAVGVAAVVLLLAVAAVRQLWVDRAPSPTTPRPPGRVVAVFPFSLQGEVGPALRDGGLVTLLSMNLDGVGPVRTVDENALIRFGRRLDEGEPLSLEEARRAAQTAGATDFIQGAIVGSESGRVRASATLHPIDTQAGGRLEVDAEGSSEDPFSLADDLAGQLLGELLEASGESLSGAAALTTSSVPALRSYLRGEAEFRATRYGRAYEFFDEAVTEDDTFALAHYRQSVAAMLDLQFDQHRLSAGRAVDASSRLSPRYGRLLMAWDALIHGRAESAEGLYQAILVDYPSSVEANFGLGAVRFYYNPVRGRSPGEAREDFERVLQLSPDFGQARFHLLELAAHRRDTIAFDSLFQRVDPESDQGLAWKAVNAVWLGEPEGSRAVEEELLRAHPVVAGLAVARVAANLQDYPQAERLAGLLAGSDRDRATRAGAHILTALMRFAQGKWSGGMEALATASRFDPAWAMELRALFTGFPLRSLSIQEASQLRDELLEWDGTEQGPSSGYPLFAHNGYHPLLRLYLLSLASIWMGDTEAAWDFAAELEREPRGPDRQQVASRWAASLRGRIAEAEGRREEAMGRLEEVRLEVPLELIAISPFFSRSLDRYRLGRLLAEHGREAEGLSWLGTLTEGYELVLAAPAHFEMGQILWGLEDREGAEEHYRRFVELWADCDEEFRPLIGVARDRLAALTDTAGGPGG